MLDIIIYRTKSFFLNFNVIPAPCDHYKMLRHIQRGATVFCRRTMAGMLTRRVLHSG